MPTGFPPRLPLRRALTALLLAAALLVLPACGDDSASHSSHAAATSTRPSPSSSAQKQKLAKTRFAANAGLAAGATYQWIVKPYKAGRFKKGASGRTATLIKAGLAGAFAYNRLKAASVNAKGDPTLNRLMQPVNAAIVSLKSLPTKLRKGQDPGATVNEFDDVIDQVKKAGKEAGAEVKDQVPSLSELGG
ncbi:hypothetical protein SAMN05216223_101171 [Actinacidiphila yanglinensis]|uniref:Uncharacterized protein n=1 Tax=Actinacidiphila yanglinensis TaxID=310779 RepID=A0A1H5SKM5_9ACTN|nr:hypothetical protein [Actinacidiphila yanglinensis]SEF51055.1 hypothetical protein SAMN05216223_101171 [Actinacidiphila yanglinensis]